MEEARVGPWAAIAATDPTCLHARAELAASATIAALHAEGQQREVQEARRASASEAIHGALECAASFSDSVWASLGAACCDEIRGLLHLLLAIVLDFCNPHDPHAAAAHYAQSAELSPPDRRVWQLRAACVVRDTTLGDAAARQLAASAVHTEAVRAGLRLRVDQRPLQLVPHLAVDATPWLDARTHPACVALAANYRRIKEEAMRLLERDVFKSERASASVRGLAVLSGGELTGEVGEGVRADWRDLSLYINGRRHESHAQLAPFTSALLGSGEGGLLRDSTSCVYGSAFFSLIAPGTRLRPHCGPTNIRVRAHLPLIVPPGDIAMRVGLGPPRPWVEGEMVLFDDSFEHEVWNHSDSPRLVLCVDFWHPLLDTDEKRLAVLDPVRARRYQQIVNAGVLESAEDAEAAKATPTAEREGGEQKSPLTGLIADVRRRALGGKSGVRALLACLDRNAAVGVVAVGGVADADLPVAVPSTGGSGPTAVAAPVVASPIPVVAAPIVAVAAPVVEATPARPAASLPPAVEATLRARLTELLPPAAMLSFLSARGPHAKRPRDAAATAAADAIFPGVHALVTTWGVASCLLVPCSFFVAWNGVVVLVYSGFPPPLASLKAALNTPSFAMKKEGFGSKWPKTTLGAVHDDAPDLSLSELERLRTLCKEHAAGLDALRVPLGSISLVEYSSRGLEAAGRRQRSDIALEDCAAILDMHTPSRTAAAAQPSDHHLPDLSSTEEQNRVAGVLSEWDDLGEYLPRVNAPGARISSYRERSPAGSTLVSFLDLQPTADLVRKLDAFRRAVDELFPGRYSWLEGESLHCTVRALDGGAG